MTASPFTFAGGHMAIFGASGRGKTKFMEGVGRARIKDPLWGLHVIDPEGQLAQNLAEFVANPLSAVAWRSVHLLRAASTTESFGLALLHVPERTPQACHEAAVRTKTIFEQVVDFGVEGYGPRLSKLFYLGCCGLALTGRPLVAMPELFTLGAAHLRELVGDVLPYEFMDEEWRSLDVLSARNPSRFLEYTEAVTSRLMPIFGNQRLRRIFGQQRGVDIAHMLAHRDIALLDLSGLEHADAVLIGTSYFSLLYHEAMQRPPERGARACVMLDEAADYLTSDVARGFDRLRKRNIQLCIGIQRLGQLDGAR